ncbi:MAG: peptide ABC transporter substrate-binding protein [Chlamydiales bacterium]|nr:peptide ABC transporter substrate-binding protein [Chlamydiales bacterium]
MKKKELEDFLLKGNLNLLPATFLEDKESQVLMRVSSLMRYWPDEELYPSLLLSLLHFPRQFKKIRSVAHLGRVVCAEFFYKKKVIKALDHFPEKRHLFLKLLKTRLKFPFGSKSVMGMVVAFNLMKHREAFEEQHILEAVRRVVPGVKVVKGSLIDQQDKQNQVHTVYFEIEREERPEFSLDEVKKLSLELPDELKGCIEQLVPMTFMRRNEEEVYRNVVTLRDQLKSPRDIPQATITFEEQTQFDLFFTVVLLRITKDKQPSVLELLERSFPDTVFIPDRIDYVGTLRKVYQKEATVFRVQISKSSFFRKDRSVNLYKARRHVVSMLMETLGPIRDYNGGLILKQNERLEDFLALMPKVYDEFFLENFFYSITPIAMQSILPPGVVKEWFLAFSELLDKEPSQKECYLLSCRKYEDTAMVIVRAEDRSFKEPLLKEIKEYEIPSLELGFSEVNHHGTFCFGFLYRPSLIDHEIDFCQIIRNSLEKWSQKLSEEQTLRIAVHGNEPSLDPRITKGDQSYIIIKMLFEGLTRIGPDGKPHLAIAKSFEVTPDFKTYTFRLRDAKWSNGMPITAYDFEYSWKNALDPQANSVFTNTLYVIKNARLAKEGRRTLEEVGIHALDEKSLRVELEYPVPYFLEVAAHWTYSLINSSIDKKYPGWAYQAGETYVCNGPFKLSEWRHHRMITVEKNPYYWDANSVKLNRITINMMERAQSDVAMLEKGEVDILGRPTTTFPIDGLYHTFEDVESETYRLNGVFILCFNTTLFPFNHKKIRQAFASVIDREKLGLQVPHEFGGASYSLLPKELSLAKSPLFPKHDLEKARALFKEGLGEIGFVKSDFPRLTLSYYSGVKRANFFEELCRQWKEAFDIPIHLENYEWGTHFKRLLEGKYQMGGIELNARWNDPLHILEFFEERSDLLNIPSWEHDQYRVFLAQAKEADSLKERNLYLKQAEAFLAEEIPAIPLYQLAGRYLKRKGIRGISPQSNFQVDFKWASKE